MVKRLLPTVSPSRRVGISRPSRVEAERAGSAGVSLGLQMREQDVHRG